MHRHSPLTAIVALMLLTTVLAGCASPPEEDPGPRTDILHHGVQLSPRAYAGADFTSFFQEAGRVGDTIGWSGDWINLPREGTTPGIVAERADIQGYRDAHLATFFDPDNGQPVRTVNNTTRDFYIASARLFAEVQNPQYLGLGVDVDKLWAGNRTVYDAFVAWYAITYAAVKEVAPRTAVFPVFHYEHVKGLRGGISEGINGSADAVVTTTDPLWHLLDDFPDRDLTAFSSYPGLYYRDPADIPDDHYAAMRDRFEGPLAITETAWHAAPWPEGWESSVAEQARYLERFFAIAPPLELMLWTHLYDQPGAEPYDSLGLIDHDRTPRDAWYVLRAQAHPDAARRDQASS